MELIGAAVEQTIQVCFVCQRVANNLQYTGRVFQIYIMLGHSYTDWYANNILRCALEYFYLKMLFESFEKQLDQTKSCEN